MDDVLAKLKVPLNRLHHDGTGGLVVGQERTGKGSSKTKFLILERIKIDDRSLCWPWTGSKHLEGYGFIRMSQGRAGSNRAVGAHRIVLSLIFGSIPNGLEVRHKCDNPVCCNPFHLEPGTHSDNMQDASKRGRMNRSGERNGRHRLTVAQLPEIRAMFQSGISKADIARKFNVGPSTIGYFLSGKSWKEVT